MDSQASSVASIPMHQKPLVAFGMPVYNQSHENQLEKAVESILGQTWKDFNLVIVDDASTDGTWELVKRLSKQDLRIKTYQNKERLGSIRNFRRCFELAKPSEFFAWASQHDWYEPDWLMEMIKVLQDDSKVSLAYPFVSQHNETGQTRNMPYQEFETVGLETHERVLKTIWAHEGAGSMVYGLFRSNTLERCGVYRDLLFPDIQLLIELGFWGSVRQVPRILWHRRIDGSYHLRRQLQSGFSHPPWYTRFSVQLVNSGALLWHRCFSPFAGSLTSRRLGWIAAQEYFLANPRYGSSFLPRRPIWLTREFLCGDLVTHHKKSRGSVLASLRQKIKGEPDECLNKEKLFSVERNNLLDKLAQERRLREEMKHEILILKRRLATFQKRYLLAIEEDAQSDHQRSHGKNPDIH